MTHPAPAHPPSPSRSGLLSTLRTAARPENIRQQARAWNEGRGPLALCAALAAAGYQRRPALALPGMALAAGVLWFLRNPSRPWPVPHDTIVAPADGRVIAVRQVDDAWWQRRMWEVTIFLSVFDVHMQRAPLTGRVMGEEWIAGRRRPAMWPSASEHNARHHIYIQGIVPVTVTQVAGLLARAIVSWVKPGQELARDDRLGVIKLGSQTLLRWPVEAGDPLVRVGDYVYGGVTPAVRVTVREG